MPGIGSRPVWAGNRRLVEAGGQFTRGFRHGLDYAFIRAHPRACGHACGACYPVRNSQNRILVPARAKLPSAGL